MTIFTTIQNRFILIREAWRTLSKNRIIGLSTTLGLLFCLVSLVSILVAWNTLPPVVPLWYSKAWGIERLATPLWLFLLPASSLLIIGVNTYIAATLTTEYLVFSQIVSLGSFVISLLSTITLIKILMLVV